RGGSLGERLQAAFQTLLEGDNRLALIIGSDSPDIPIQYVKRAFLKLKHKDVVLGPACDGGYYMVGLKSPAPELFDDIDWGGQTVFEQTLERIYQSGLTLSIMPLWYDVDTSASLSLLATMIRARRIERSGRLPATEAVLAEILASGS
ncbi:MAG: glycosyltransferase, partial [Candidatus Krumholzibacteria bacterium]|nr:glycosyltransferase [Candidatus Krumholzibacteria bacterium]